MKNTIAIIGHGEPTVGPAQLKLFLFEDILSDYTNGIAFAYAEDQEDAIQLILKTYRQEGFGGIERLERELRRDPPVVVEKKQGFFVAGCSG